MPLALVEGGLSAALLLVNAAAVALPVVLLWLLARLLPGLRRGERGLFRRGSVLAPAAVAVVLAVGVGAFYAPQPLAPDRYDFSDLSCSAGRSYEPVEAAPAQREQVRELLSRYRCRRMGRRMSSYGADDRTLELTVWDAERRETVHFVFLEEGAYRYTAVNTGFCYAVLDPEGDLRDRLRAVLEPS